MSDDFGHDCDEWNDARDRELEEQRARAFTEGLAKGDAMEKSHEGALGDGRRAIEKGGKTPSEKPSRPTGEAPVPPGGDESTEQVIAMQEAIEAVILKAAQWMEKCCRKGDLAPGFCESYGCSSIEELLKPLQKFGPLPQEIPAMHATTQDALKAVREGMKSIPQDRLDAMEMMTADARPKPRAPGAPSDQRLREIKCSFEHGPECRCGESPMVIEADASHGPRCAARFQGLPCTCGAEKPVPGFRAATPEKGSPAATEQPWPCRVDHQSNKGYCFHTGCKPK